MVPLRFPHRGDCLLDGLPFLDCRAGLIENGWKMALERQEAYLQTILDGTRAAIKQGQTIQQAIATVGESERNQWLLFDLFNKRNVTAVYSEVEWED